jgi:hypothetical protein
MKIKPLYLLLFLGIFAKSNAQKIIKLYEEKAPGSESWNWSEAISTINMFNTEIDYNVPDPTITTFIPYPAISTVPAVIIAPGGIKYTYENGPSGHTFLAWRSNLYDFAQLLFK